MEPAVALGGDFLRARRKGRSDGYSVSGLVLRPGEDIVDAGSRKVILGVNSESSTATGTFCPYCGSLRDVRSSVPRGRSGGGSRPPSGSKYSGL